VIEYSREASAALDREDDREEREAYKKWEQSECDHIYGTVGISLIHEDQVQEALLSDDFEEDDNCRRCGYDFWKSEGSDLNQEG